RRRHTRFSRDWSSDVCSSDLFLAERPYYKDLFKLNIHDYKAWAHGLKKAGYATNPKYAGILISRIEKYNLNQFDKLKPEEVQKKLIDLYGPTEIIALSGMAESTTDLIAATVPSPVAAVVANTAEQPIKRIEIEKRA